MQINNTYGWHNAPVFGDESSSDVTSPTVSPYGSQDEESPVNSAPTTPKKRQATCTPPGSTQGTPKKVKELENLIPEWDPTCNLTRADRELFNEGLDALAETRDTPNSKKRSTLANRIASTGIRTLFTEGTMQDPNSPHFHRAAAEGLDSSPWVGQLLEEASRAHHTAQHRVEQKMQRIINIDHLIEFDKRGFHFCPENHADRQNIKMFNINPTTGVWCGFLQGKFSTFFPNWVHSQEELVRVINESEFIYCTDNRELRLVRHPNEEYNFYLEAYVRNGVKYQSIFPLFCYEEWQPNRYYKITDSRTITSEQALVAALQLGNKAIRFSSEHFITVDISAALDTKDTIKQGIYFTFPNDALEYI